MCLSRYGSASYLRYVFLTHPFVGRVLISASYVVSQISAEDMPESFCDEVLPPADCHVSHKHSARMLIEERPQAGKNRIDPVIGNDGEHDHLAARVVEQQMPLMKSVVPLP